MTNIIRQNKIRSLLHQEIATILRDKMDTHTHKALITVSRVYISPGFFLAKIYLSIFPVHNKEKILLHIIDKSHYYRNLLANRIRNHCRMIPQLKFIIDHSLDNLDKIDYELRCGGHNPINI